MATNIDEALVIRLSPRIPVAENRFQVGLARSGCDTDACANIRRPTMPTTLDKLAVAMRSARLHRPTARARLAAVILANLDLLLLFGLLTNDLRIRIPPGNIIASFTLLELFVWGYCFPHAMSCLALRVRHLPWRSYNFFISVAGYGLWLGLIAVLGLLLRGSSDPLQNIKNVVPGWIMAAFLLLRIRDMRSVVVLSNAYVFYGVLAAGLAIMQVSFGGPYLRDLIDGIEYKADFLGEYMANPAVGFSRHPNEFAMSIIPALSLAAVKFWFDLRRRWISVAAFSVSALLLAAIGLAQAKGAFVFFTAALVFVISPLGNTRGFVIKLLWVSTLICLIVVFGVHTAETSAFNGAATIEVRYLLWQTAFRGIAADNYIGAFGDGGNYIARWSESYAGWEFLDAHNTWIDQIALYGFPAFALYLAIWWSFFRTLDTRGLVASHSVVILLEGFRVSLLAIMGDAFFEPLSNDVAGVAQPLLIMSMALLAKTLGPHRHRINHKTLENQRRSAAATRGSGSPRRNLLSRK